MPLVRSKIRTVTGTEHLPSTAPYILAANHTGYLDGAAIVVVILKQLKKPIYFLTRQEVWRVLGGWLAQHLFGMIPVRTGDKRESLKDAIALLGQKEIIGIFPEGTRNDDTKQLLQGKTGAVRLALEAGVPLIPVGISNTTGHYLRQALNSLWKKDKGINVVFGPPVSLDEFKNKPVDKPLLYEATRKLMKEIGKLCDKEYQH